MSTSITSDLIASSKDSLENHPVYAAVRTLDDLRVFMQHHVYSVWDFMSLLKYLQSVIAPSGAPWSHQGDAAVRRFINELVLEEETDKGLEPGSFSSHFELYRQAMGEVGADVALSSRYVETVAEAGVSHALETVDIPTPSKRFTDKTFEFIRSDKPHRVAAALALGREHIIPCMFRSILRQTGVSEDQAPAFHYYLHRHVHLDEGHHGPMSLRLLNQLCGDDEDKTQEAVEAAHEAIQARIQFWDGVLEAIEGQRSA
ncbi:MAG: DUF3050 domain-containing protein [Chromatiales bacterium]|jgi:hypothetical protein